MSKEAQAVEPATTQPADEKLEPIQPVELIKRAVAYLKDVPWVSLGTIGTGVGMALLGFYFSSIGFVPANIPSILSAGLLVAMQALVFTMAVVFGLTAPLAAYRAMNLESWQQEGEEQKLSARVSGLWALQFVGVGGLLLYIGVSSHLDCSPVAGYFIALGLLFALTGFLGWWFHEKKAAIRQGVWATRLGYAMLVCTVATLPFWALWEVLITIRETGWRHLIAFLFLWLLVVGGTSLLQKMPLWACVFLVTGLMPILLYSVPTFLGSPASFPSKVAEFTGIRGKGVDQLRLPHSTCELIQSAVGNAQTDKPVACVPGGWGTVHAQVLSNLGDRWWIEVKLAGKTPEERGGAVRLTIPGDGVQTVRQINAPAAKDKAAGCRV